MPPGRPITFGSEWLCMARKTREAIKSLSACVRAVAEIKVAEVSVIGSSTSLPECIREADLYSPPTSWISRLIPAGQASKNFPAKLSKRFSGLGPPA